MKRNKFLKFLNLLLEIFLNPIVLIILILMGFVFESDEFAGTVLSLAVILRQVSLSMKREPEERQKNPKAWNILLLVLSLILLVGGFYLFIIADIIAPNGVLGFIFVVIATFFIMPREI